MASRDIDLNDDIVTSSAGPSTSSAGPSTSSAGPSTSSAGPSTSSAGPSTSSRACYRCGGAAGKWIPLKGKFHKFAMFKDNGDDMDAENITKKLDGAKYVLGPLRRGPNGRVSIDLPKDGNALLPLMKFVQDHFIPGGGSRFMTVEELIATQERKNEQAIIDLTLDDDDEDDSSAVLTLNDDDSSAVHDRDLTQFSEKDLSNSELKQNEITTMEPDMPLLGFEGKKYTQIKVGRDSHIVYVEKRGDKFVSCSIEKRTVSNQGTSCVVMSIEKRTVSNQGTSSEDLVSECLRCHRRFYPDLNPLDYPATPEQPVHLLKPPILSLSFIDYDQNLQRLKITVSCKNTRCAIKLIEVYAFFPGAAKKQLVWVKQAELDIREELPVACTLLNQTDWHEIRVIARAVNETGGVGDFGTPFSFLRHCHKD